MTTQTNTSNSTLLTLDEVAARLRVRDRRTAKRQLAQAGVGFIRIGRNIRVRSNDLDRLLDQNHDFFAPRAGAADQDPDRTVGENPPRASEKPARNGAGRPQSTTAGSKPARGKNARRGWRETVEPGLYKAHRVACPASPTRQPRIDCDCPWQVHVRGSAPGQSRLKSFHARNLTEARDEKKRLQAPPRNDAPNGNGDISLSRFFYEVFIQKRVLAASTIRTYRDVFVADIEPYLGTKRLAEISGEDVDQWLQQMVNVATRRRRETKRRNPRFVKGRFAVLSAILGAAARWRRIPINPCSGTRLPDCPPASPGEAESDPQAVLNLTQIERLFQAVLKHPRQSAFYLCLFRVALELGLRNGELRGIRLSDINFTTGHVQIKRQIAAIGARETLTKGKRSRELPISTPTLILLRQVANQQLIDGFRNRDRFLLSLTPDQPLGHTTANRNLRQFEREAGLVDKNGEPLITLHGLRHTCATLLLVDRGLDLISVSRYLGHSDPIVTLRTYAHLFADDDFGSVIDYWAELSNGAGGNEDPLSGEVYGN